VGALELIIVGGALLVMMVVTVAVMLALRVQAGPGEIVVLLGGPGGKRIVPSGQVRVRKPLIEKAERLRAELPPVEAHMVGVYCREAARMIVDVDATVRLALTEPGVHHAIERFLGQSGDAVTRVARESIEGHVRGVLARLSSAEACSDAEKLGQEVIGAAEHDLGNLGIELVELRIRARDARM
jgi:flotillin